VRQIKTWTIANGGAPAVFLVGMAALAVSRPLAVALMSIGIIWFVLWLEPVRKGLIRFLSHGDGTDGLVQQGAGVQHIYNAPVTINSSNADDPFGPPPTNAPARRDVGPAERLQALPEIRLADYVDYPDDGPAIIQNRTFRNALLRGPMILYLLQGITIKGSNMGVDDLETILWPVEVGTSVVGPVVVKNVVIEDCELAYIGFAGPEDHLDLLRQGTRH
jgi:hypothetical protein